MEIFKDSYPILNAKFNEQAWLINIQTYNFNAIRKNIYKPENELDILLYDYHTEIINRTFIDLKVNEMAVSDYMYKMDELIYKEDISEKDKGRVVDLYEHLEKFNCYLIGGNYYPQIVMSEKQGRVFFHPIFNWKAKWVDALFFKFDFFNLIESNQMLVKFDINAAIPRAMFFYLYTKTGIKQFKKLAMYKGEFYHALFKLMYQRELDDNTRSVFKQDFLAYLFGGKRLNIEQGNKNIMDYINNDIITLGVEYINKYTSLFIMKILKSFDAIVGNFYMPMLNYDGGYILIENNDFIYNSLKNKYPFMTFANS